MNQTSFTTTLTLRTNIFYIQASNYLLHQIIGYGPVESVILGLAHIHAGSPCALRLSSIAVHALDSLMRLVRR